MGQKEPAEMGKLTEQARSKSTLMRLRRVRTSLAEKGLDALLTSQPENMRYLSGFTGSSGWLLISERSAILVTDFRYVEQARRESPDFEIIQAKQEVREWFPGLVSDFGWHKIGFEAHVVSYDGYHKLSESMKTKRVQIELVPTTGIVEQLRSVKDSQELAFMTKAIELADAVFEEVRATLHPGMTEKEIAWQVEKSLREKGSEGVPFEIIVASGPNSALPHAQPTEKTVSFGEPVLIDMGARIGGYCSDFSRTLFLGKADKTFQEIYNIVLKAQTVAIEGVRSGMDAREADRLARSVIEEAGYGEAFGHGLGHGVGLATHEAPAVNSSSSDLLADGMVFTIEPGIYLVGWGGVRIEDMVVLEEGRAKVLTQTRKEPSF
jgi:Xaa-Pro aminopeptidase